MTDSKAENTSRVLSISSVKTIDEDSDSNKGTNTKVSADREEFLNALRDLQYEYNKLLIKNNILQRRLADYYKKRKLDHVLKSIDNAQELEDKYYQKLHSYEELKLKQEIELNDIGNKLNVVEMLYEDRRQNVENLFGFLQNLERTTGIGLIYSKKGKPIADKTVDWFLKLQKNKSEQCTALRLRFIRARNAVADLESIVKKLEKLGPGLYVAHYEQLAIDHQNLMNKIEEKEDELIKSRGRCTEHNQILAHIREKMHHTDEQIDFAECDLGDAELEYLRAREDLGEVKTQRDKLRTCLVKEKEIAGLLTRNDLLKDYQDSIDEVEKIKKEKADLQHQIARNAIKLQIARRRTLESLDNDFI